MSPRVNPLGIVTAVRGVARVIDGNGDTVTYTVAPTDATPFDAADDGIDTISVRAACEQHDGRRRRCDPHRRHTGRDEQHVHANVDSSAATPGGGVYATVAVAPAFESSVIARNTAAAGAEPWRPLW